MRGLAMKRAQFPQTLWDKRTKPEHTDFENKTALAARPRLFCEQKHLRAVANEGQNY